MGLQKDYKGSMSLITQCSDSALYWGMTWDHSCQGPEQFIPKEPSAGKALPKTPPGLRAGESERWGNVTLAVAVAENRANTLRRALPASPADADRPWQIF